MSAGRPRGALQSRHDERRGVLFPWLQPAGEAAVTSSEPLVPSVSPVEVRAATPADRGALLRLLVADLAERGAAHEVAAHEVAAHEVEAVERAVEIALSSGSAAWLLVASRGGFPVGVLLANPIVTARAGGAALAVDALYVVPDKRRNGVGRALLTHAAREARLNGMGALLVEVDPRAPSAIAARGLVTSMGAVPTGAESFRLGG